MSRISESTASFIANNRSTFPIRLTAGIASWFLQAYNNSLDTNMVKNGESFILKSVEPFYAKKNLPF